MSFRLKTIIGIAAIEITVMAILIIVNQLSLGGSAQAQLFVRARDTASLFATMVTDALIATDLATLDAMAENVFASESLVYVRVRAANGLPLAQAGEDAALAAAFSADTGFETATTDHRIDIAAPIEVGGTRFGSVEIGISTLPLEQEAARSLYWTIMVAMIGVLLVALFGAALGSILTRQLRHLREGAQLIADGKLETRVPIHGRDDLAQTAACFNDMAEALLQERSALQTRQAELLRKRDRVHHIVRQMNALAGGKLDIIVPHQELGDEIGDMARATAIFQIAMRELEEAHAKQTRLIVAFNKLDELVAIFDPDGRAIFTNTSFRQLNAWILNELPPDFTYADFLEVGVTQGAFPEAQGQEEAWIEKTLSSISVNTSTVEVLRAPDRHLLVRRTPVPGVGFVVTAADITELRDSQAQLAQAAKMATLGEMATGLAHELNQPLGVIRMAAGNCLKRLDRGDADKDYLIAKMSRIDEQTGRAAQIIDHMRIFGRKDDGARERFDLATAVQNACNLMQKQLEAEAIDLTFETDRVPRFCVGQKVMLEQVVLNLITNARDAIEAQADGSDGSDGGKIRVSLSAGQGPDTHMLRIADTGGGIPRDVLDRLFDPFFTTKAPGKGTGLGLSISYGIIGEIGGSISATNIQGGALFRIDLPAAAADDAGRTVAA